jgi:hypothetical protein
VKEIYMNVYAKLANVQSALKAPKGQYNSFGKYKYRSCEDIVESVKPLLKKEGLLLNLTDTIELIGDRYYVKATAIIIDTADGNMVSVEAYAREEESKKGMDGSQVTGASSSYARKYALNGIFAIDDTKDSDSTNTGDEHPRQEQPKKQMTPREQLIARLNELGINITAFAQAKGLNAKATDETYLRLLKELENA